MGSYLEGAQQTALGTPGVCGELLPVDTFSFFLSFLLLPSLLFSFLPPFLLPSPVLSFVPSFLFPSSRPSFLPLFLRFLNLIWLPSIALGCDREQTGRV